MPTRSTTKRPGSARRQPSASARARAALAIDEHRLTGPQVAYRDTPNRGGVITPRYLVFHYTAGKSAESSVAWLTNPDAKASAHLVLGRDGRITQLAPFNIKTWHAGRSAWDGLKGLNAHSIGIEMDNAGPLRQVGDTLQAWFGKTYPKNQAVYARHKWEAESRWWHAYTEQQIERAIELATLLVRTYHLIDIVGHEDIAPERKRDPGPAFPLDHIQSLVMGRPEDEPERYEVSATALNIRGGPGTQYARVAEPLHRGTIVLILEKRDRWSRVEVEDEPEIEGWVCNAFLRPAEASPSIE
ncbi:MAG: N-acetylmuramoyl-L-alanine amidase [Nitrospirae bacterium]|nr:MAG: N-acetylmuramoyl-L-alanine amidase [Nitrospirota bacterium]